MIIEKELAPFKSLISEINIYAHFLDKVLYLENGYGSVQLYGAIDNSETIDCQRIFILTDFLSDRIRIVGGSISYLLSQNNLRIISTHTLKREENFLEYWSTNIIEKEELIYIELESEILILSKDLEIVKVFQKYFNERIVQITEDRIIIDSDGVQRVISL